MSHLYDQSPLGKGFSGDLFGRLKVSNPVTLFDSTNVYQINDDFHNLVVGTGSTVGIITAESSVISTIGTDSNSSIITESKRVFSYQPGKSLQVFQTFVLNPPKENLVQRVGYASSENGVMLEINDFNINIIKRTAISGVGVTITIPQSEWNQDRLDGNGPSGYELDLTKAQILFTEYEWLGVGSVRVGFAIDGKFIIAHQFDHANLINSVYMTTATLPIRFEIMNKAETSSSSNMKQICTSVQSNGGYEKKTSASIARRSSFISSSGTDFVPLVSIRLKPGRTDSVIIPYQINILSDSSTSVFYEIALIKNTTIIGGNWSITSSPNVEQNNNSTSMSGGTIIKLEYTTSANRASVPLNVEEQYNWDLQLGRTIDKVSDTYTLAFRAITGNGNAVGAISFYDLT
jgi:hypothetical protein